MPRLVISEKTLELNVTAELLQSIRQLPGCDSAFWIGMKQQQEMRLGTDEILANLPKGYFLALQFKAPARNPPGGNPHWFSINERQHTNLCRLASNRPDAVFYVLPHLNTTASVQNASPHLLASTWSARVADMMWVGPGSHRIESVPPAAFVHSETTPFELNPLEGIIRSVLEDRGLLLTQEIIGEWIRGLEDTVTPMSPHALGQMFRGFGALWVRAT